jgi:hypothetical protein
LAVLSLRGLLEATVGQPLPRKTDAPPKAIFGATLLSAEHAGFERIKNLAYRPNLDEH